MNNSKLKPSEELAILEAYALELWILAVREYEKKNNPRLLQKQLQQAVESEDFERACVLRDRLAQKNPIYNPK